MYFRNRNKKYSNLFNRYSDGGATGIEPKEEGGTKTEESKTYSDEDVEKKIEKETEKRVATALKKAEKTTAQKIQEAQRLSKMSEEERNQEKIKQLELELQGRENEIAKRENKLTCMAEMEKRNIPTSLVDFLVTADAETMLSNLTTFEKTLKKLVNDEVQKRIGTQTPKRGNTDTEPLTKENFKKLNLSEQNKIFIDSPDLYKQLTQ